MKNPVSTFAICVALAGSVLHGNAANASEALEKRIGEINVQYEQRFAALKKEGEGLNDGWSPSAFEAGVGFSGNVTWEVTTIKLDLPAAKMKRRDIKLHLPQWTHKTVSIKWDVPQFYSAIRVIGKYPCFYHWKWHSCEIKTKVPQLRMLRRESKFDVPVIKWATTTLKLDIPEFYTRRTEIKLHLPQFHGKDVHAEIGKRKAAGNAIERKSLELGKAQAVEINAAVQADLAAEKAGVSASFDDAVRNMDTAISQMRAAGVNPEAVVTEEGTQNFILMLNDLKRQRDEALRKFDIDVTKPSS